MTSKDWQMWRGNEFRVFGTETQKARTSNERLCHGTESEWMADEREHGPCRLV